MTTASAVVSVQDEYFAKLTGEEFAAELCRRVDRYQEHLLKTGFWALYARAYQTFYGMGTDGFTSHEVRRKGKKGEYSALAINHFRNLVTHYLTLASAQRAAMEPMAAHTDWRSEMEVRIARGVLDFYMRAHLEQSLLDATEYAAILGEGWVGQGWNAHLGEPTMPDVLPEDAPPDAEAPMLRTGDLESWPFMPQDVARDPKSKTGDVDWTIDRRWVNRWDLVAQFPELRDEILAAGSGRREQEVSIEGLYLQGDGGQGTLQDQVALYRFIHKRTPACPEGREALFLSERVLLMSDVLSYAEAPIRRVTPQPIIGTPFGSTPAWDLLAPQEAVNALESIGVTNQRAHGVGIILAPKGSDVRAEQITKGLGILRYNPGMKPELANFTGTPPEVFRNSDRMVGHMETIIGVNSVVRGNPEASLKSGSALALVQAQAVQFASKFQGAIVRFMEQVGQDTVGIFQLYATEPLRFDVGGEDSVLLTQEFIGENIANIRRVQVDVGNPLAKTLAGRVQLAENLVKLGVVKDATQYIRVLETGRLEPMTEKESRERSCIKAENELLTRAEFILGEDGQPQKMLVEQTGRMDFVIDRETLPIALVTDNHLLHVPEHLALLSSPRARRNPALRRAVMEHIRQHHDEWFQATLSNPGMLELAGVPPMQAALGYAQAQMAGAGAPPPGGPGAPGQPSAGGNPALPPGKPAAPALPGQAPPEQDGMPKMPQLPPGAAQVTGSNPAAPGPTGEV